MPDRPLNVLFLCTGNTARSILAESILRKIGAGRFASYSAGSHPKGTVNPLALKVLASRGFPVDDLRSKSWDEYGGPGAPRMDFVFTVCDGAAGESCPLWPGRPTTGHWGIEDPAAVSGSDTERERAFERAFQYLSRRIEAFVALPIERLGEAAIQTEVRRIGRMDGATTVASED